MSTKVKSYELVKTKHLRERKVFSLFPFITTRGYTTNLHTTGKWFSYIKIKERKIKERYMIYDSNTKEHFWGSWTEDWITEIIYL